MGLLYASVPSMSFCTILRNHSLFSIHVTDLITEGKTSCYGIYGIQYREYISCWVCLTVRKNPNYSEAAAWNIWCFSMTLILCCWNQCCTNQCCDYLTPPLPLVLICKGYLVRAKTLSHIDIHTLGEISTYCMSASLQLRINHSSLWDVSSYTLFKIMMQFKENILIKNGSF